VETLTLIAREKGERDPIEWASRTLSQGPEPKLAAISSLQTDPSRFTENNFYETDSGFEYTKLFYPEKGEGIRIVVPRGFNGFLGASSQLGSDLGVSLVFLGIYFLTFFATRKDSEAPLIRAQILKWLKDFRSDFTDLGIHLREIIRAAQKMAVSASQSKIQVVSLGEKLHIQLNDIHLGVKSANESEKSAKEVEQILIGVLGQIPAEIRAEVDRAILISRRAHVTANSARVLFQEVEKRIEPIVTDADQALNPFDSFFVTTQELNGEITDTTAAIKKLSDELTHLSA
jgi:hypothetical protein